MSDYTAKLATLDAIEQKVLEFTAGLPESELSRIARAHQEYDWSKDVPDIRSPSFSDWKYHGFECLPCVTYVLDMRRQALLQEQDIDRIRQQIFAGELK